jgi:hypothetical protein
MAVSFAEEGRPDLPVGPADDTLDSSATAARCRRVSLPLQPGVRQPTRHAQQPHPHRSRELPQRDRPVAETESPSTADALSALAREACQLVGALEPLGAALGVAGPETAAWHGALFGTLAAQAARGPLVVAAVCGGTNTGKSLVANSLVGASISRSIAEAARTRHPVASLPAGVAAAADLAALFPGFTPVPWRSDEDALDPAADDRIVWREDPSGRQPARLVIIDTPDIDGTLLENWQRAELVRDAADVIVAVLTQQKYNDAAVREFFSAAVAAGRTVLVIFNMVDWPAQRQRVAGWLATFVAETGASPLAVYAVPHDTAAAAAGRITFHALPELGSDGRAAEVPATASEPPTPAERLAGCDFDRIKRRAVEGAWRMVVARDQGMPAWLDTLDQAAGAWRRTAVFLDEASRVRVDLPAAPREIVWNEIWAWLEPRRSTFDLTVSRVYRIAGQGVAWAARGVGLGRSAAERRADFSAEELAGLKQALTAFVACLDDACRKDARLEGLLGPVLASSDRAAWYADLERRHAALPMVSDDYRGFVKGQLDRFAEENPGLVRWIVVGLNAGAVARPALTVGLGLAGAAVVPAAAATAGGLTTLVSHVGDVVVGTAATIAGEGALGLTAAGLAPLVERLFAGWSAERGRVLAETIHDLVLGDRLDEIHRLATAAERPELLRARQLLDTAARTIA